MKKAITFLLLLIASTLQAQQLALPGSPALTISGTTLNWTAVEGAAYYKVIADGGESIIVDADTLTFEGQSSVNYTVIAATTTKPFTVDLPETFEADGVTMFNWEPLNVEVQEHEVLCGVSDTREMIVPGNVTSVGPIPDGKGTCRTVARIRNGAEIVSASSNTIITIPLTTQANNRLCPDIPAIFPVEHTVIAAQEFTAALSILQPSDAVVVNGEFESWSRTINVSGESANPVYILSDTTTATNLTNQRWVVVGDDVVVGRYDATGSGGFVDTVGVRKTCMAIEHT